MDSFIPNDLHDVAHITMERRTNLYDNLTAYRFVSA